MNNLSKLFSKKIGRGNFALCYIPTTIVAFFAIGGLSNYEITPFGGVVLIIAALYTILLVIQRLNDLEMSWWYLLLTLIPLVNLVLGMILLTRKGGGVSNIILNSEKKSPKKKPTWLDKIIAETNNTEISVNDTEEVVKQARGNDDETYCGHCGVKHTKDARFCSSCGKSFI